MKANPRLPGNSIPAIRLSPAEQMDELQQLYDQAPCGYHSLDQNGVFIRINQTELTMLGYTREEILGHKRFVDVLTLESQKIFAANFPKFKQKGNVSDLEFQLICKNGDLLPVSVSATAIKDPNGNYVMSRSVVIDIRERQRLEADRQQAEANLRNSENRYRLLFETNPNPMWIYDPETLAFLEVNQAAIEHYGYAEAEFLQMTIADIRPADAMPAFHQANQVLKPGQPHSGVWQHRKKDGSLIHVEIMAHAFEWAGQQANLVQTKDITALKWMEADRQKTETALQEAHQRVISIWESMTDAYVTIDHDWRFIYLNQAALQVITQLSGIEPDQILGKSHWEVFPMLAGGPLQDHYQQAIDQQMPVHFELPYEPTDNWFEIHVYPSEIGLGVYFRDITDRKVAEQKIREQANLLAVATDAIFVHDLDNRILFWNQGAETLYGWTEGAMLGQDWRALLSPDTPLDLAAVIELENWQGEVPKITQTGQSILVMSRRSVMLDDDGQPKSILTVDTDITEKKQLETQFLRAQRLESLGTLSSGIAHDLNNVLTPIIGIVQLLPAKIPNLDPQTQRLLQILNDSARRGADLVKQILSFTRGLEGKPTSTQVTHLIAEIQKIIRQTFPKNIDLSLNLTPNLRMIAADATMLHQVFMNLCVNARDAMPNGGQLTIKTENLTLDENYARMNLDAHAGPYVAVTIADTGMGIPAAIIDRIFDPFFTTKDIGKGTGLGLSTVIGIVKSHQGFINVYSEVGKGTRFTVYLPATEMDEDETIDEGNQVPIGHGELILVVDDESAIQEITQVTLEASGYAVMTASDGIEAIALYAEHKRDISVILLDMMMPSLDAATTIRTLCKLNPQVQIIAMSGLATNESVTKTMKDGVQAFLAKPFTAPELLNLLASTLAQKSA